MVKLKHSDMRVFNDAFDMHSGYVLDFIDRTFAEFFEDEFSIKIYQEKYGLNGTSKAKHLRAFIAVEDAFTVAKVLRALWQYRESLPSYSQPSAEADALRTRFFDLVARIEGSDAVARTDRLHTYCMKKFAHLLDERAFPRTVTTRCRAASAST